MPFDANVSLHTVQPVNRKIKQVAVLVFQQQKIVGVLVDFQVDQPLVNADSMVQVNNKVINLKVGK